MEGRFVFKRNADGDIDLSERALRKALGADTRIVADACGDWRIVSAAEEEFLRLTKERMFSTNPPLSFVAALNIERDLHPLLFRISRAGKAATTAADANFVLEGGS